MKKNLLIISGMFSLIALILAWGCKKDGNTVDSTPLNVNSVEKSSLDAMNIFEELNVLAETGLGSTNLKSGDLNIGNCPGISFNIIQAPLTVTLDWGTGCTGTDNVKRSGKIVITLTGMMNVVNSVATFKFVDFVTDGKKISGVHKITYMGPNPTNNWPRYLTLTEAKITYPDNTFETYRAEIWRLQSAGRETASVLDDTWRMEGSSSGVAKDGSKWTARSVSVLVKKGDCKWISSGKWVITPEKGAISTIDFGKDETCDDKATLTVGDKTTTITL
jgi:hypothetical protein